MTVRNLASRLTQLRKQSGAKIQTARTLAAEKKLADKIKLARVNSSADKPNSCDDETLAKLLGGTVYQSGLILIQQSQKLSALHAVYNSAFQKNTVQLEETAEFQHLLFVDTETSGLSSAAGTLVFLLGAGEIIGDELVLEQMLLTRISAEPVMLHWFNKKCEHKTHLVSYNGKSFDVPLLTTRFRMNRLGSHLLVKKHIDLLHWIRRLHQQQMADCRLPSAEAFCLGFHRKEDIPGAEVPFVWQAFIRYGKTDRLKAVIQHHAWDVASLVGLLHYANKLMSSESQLQYNVYQASKYLVKNNENEKAKTILEQRVNTLDTDALYLLGEIYRKENRWQEAVAIWQQLKEQGHEGGIESLAKYYEHKEKDYLAAYQIMECLNAKQAKEQHQIRMRRLQRKMANAQSYGLMPAT